MKFAITLFTLYSLLIVGTTLPVSAQSQTQTEEIPSAAAPIAAQNKSALKDVFAIETEKLKGESASFDVERSKRDNARQQTKKKGWSTTNKLLLAAAIVGFVGLMFVVIKYGKNCLRSSPAGCTPGVDESCVCEEYERRIPQSP